MTALKLTARHLEHERQRSDSSDTGFMCDLLSGLMRPDRSVPWDKSTLLEKRMNKIGKVIRVPVKYAEWEWSSVSASGLALPRRLNHYINPLLSPVFPISIFLIPPQLLALSFPLRSFPGPLRRAVGTRRALVASAISVFPRRYSLYPRQNCNTERYWPASTRLLLSLRVSPERAGIPRCVFFGPNGGGLNGFWP